MIRWSYVDVTVITLLIPRSESVRGAIERYSAGKSREGVEGAQDRPSHEVGEAVLAAAGRVAVLVVEASVLFQRAHRHQPHGGGGGGGEARLHVLDDAGGAAPDRRRDVAGQDRG